MARAGTPTTAEAKEAYESLQSKHAFHWIVFVIRNDQIEVEAKKSKEEAFDYAEFENHLRNAGGARYAVLDYYFKDKDAQKSKVVFITWVPEGAKVQDKMKYASSKDGFKRNLNGIQKDLEAHDEADLEESRILNACLA